MTPAVPPRRRSGGLSDVRETLDAFRRIVQALRVGGGGRALTSAQRFALQQIADHPNASVNDIASLTFTHQSSVSVVIARLVRKGLVARVLARDDHRRVSLAITERGRRALSRTPAAKQEQLIAAIAALTAADRRVLARSLGTISDAVAPPHPGEHPPMFFEDHQERRLK
jgi:DNA-binding MarR family transcriptional regulator